MKNEVEKNLIRDFIYAINNRQPNKAINIIEGGLNVDAIDSEGTPIIFHALIEQDVFNALIDRGAKLACYNSEAIPLLLEAIFTSPAKAKIIVEKTRDTVNMVNKDGQNCLHAAAEAYNMELMELFINYGADINAADIKGNTPLHAASFYKQPNSVELLIKAGAEVNPQNKYGDTPKHYAARNGDAESLKKLWHKDNHIEIENHNKFTPLLCSAFNGKQNTIEFLLSKGAKMDVQTKEGKTALHLVSEKGYPKLVRLLCEKGHKTDICDNKGYTALQSAILNSKYKTVKELVGKGADKDAKINGKNTIELAEFVNNERTNKTESSKIIDLLKEPPVQLLAFDSPYICQEGNSDWLRYSDEYKKISLGSTSTEEISLKLTGYENPDSNELN
jgi:ankyrin repeat protein